MSYTERRRLRSALEKKEYAKSVGLSATTASSPGFVDTLGALSRTVAIKKTRTAALVEFSMSRSASHTFVDTSPNYLTDEAVMEEDYKNIIDRYKRGEYIFRDHAKEQRENIDMEANLYLDAARSLQSGIFISGSADTPIGSVALPEDSPTKVKELESRQAYIGSMKVKLQAFDKLQYYRTTIASLHNAINDQEEQVGIHLLDIETNKTAKDFDWLVMMHNKVRALKAQIEVDKEDLLNAQEKYEEIADIIQKKYPDMSASMSLGIFEPSVGTGEEGSVGASTMTSGAPEPLVNGWILGRLSSDNKITCILYGQFTTSQLPPETGWIYVGKNISLDGSSKTTHSLHAGINITTSL